MVRDSLNSRLRLEGNGASHPVSRSDMPMWTVIRHGFVGLGVALAVAVAVAACSSEDACVDSGCAAGNRCLALGGETKCRKTCTSNSDPLTSCPFGFTCTDTLQGQPAFCVQSAARTPDGSTLTQKPTGQWGQPCRANLTIDNPDCDRDQGFYCYGTSPTDATAYCTRYDCTNDDECGPGFWCTAINQTPSVDSARRATIGATQKLCLRRSYCATCNVDLDCPTLSGKVQHCIVDASGLPFCAPECTTASNCPNEAQCVDAGIGANVCYPRATVCVGDGSLCSPCRSDADCGDDGICLQGEFTTEKACGKRPIGDCRTCPSSLASPKRGVGCSEEDSPTLPKRTCAGIYELAGSGADVGCWTPNR